MADLDVDTKPKICQYCKKGNGTFTYLKCHKCPKKNDVGIHQNCYSWIGQPKLRCDECMEECGLFFCEICNGYRYDASKKMCPLCERIYCRDCWNEWHGFPIGGFLSRNCAKCKIKICFKCYEVWDAPDYADTIFCPNCSKKYEKDHG